MVRLVTLTKEQATGLLPVLLIIYQCNELIQTMFFVSFLLQVPNDFSLYKQVEIT